MHDVERAPAHATPGSALSADLASGVPLEWALRRAADELPAPVVEATETVLVYLTGRGLVLLDAVVVPAALRDVRADPMNPSVRFEFTGPSGRATHTGRVSYRSGSVGLDFSVARDARDGRVDLKRVAYVARREATASSIVARNADLLRAHEAWSTPGGAELLTDPRLGLNTITAEARLTRDHGVRKYRARKAVHHLALDEVGPTAFAVARPFVEALLTGAPLAECVGALAEEA